MSDLETAQIHLDAANRSVLGLLEATNVLIRERDEALDEVVRLRQGIWDMMAALGLDTDGDSTPGAQMGDLAAMGVAFAKDWRKDYDDLLDEAP